MKNPPVYWNKAKAYLSKKDKVLKYLIKNYNVGYLVSRNDVFFLCAKVLQGNK